MASVSLGTVWLTLVSDQTDSVSFVAMTQLTSTPQNAGQVRRYASGRTRAVVPVGVPNQFQLVAAACSRDVIVWLESHTGQLLLVRDDRGRKFYGTYFQPGTAEHAYDLEGDVSLTIDEVSYSEAV